MKAASSNSQTVAVIGAGIAGLGAARALKTAGFEVTVFEKGFVPGGRISSHRAAGLLFDSGAQNIKSADTAFDNAVREVLPESDIIEITAPVCLHHNGTILPPDAGANAARKWSCRGGLSRLGEAFAQGLEVHYGTGIAAIEEKDDSFILLDSESKSLGAFERIVCAVPLPQAAALLNSVETGGERLQLLADVQYSRCLTLLLHFEATLESGWYALLAQDRTHPLLWLANENAKDKGSNQSGTALVAQLGPGASEELWEASEEVVTRKVTTWIAELLGEHFLAPQFCTLQRWAYAQPRNPIDFDAVNTSGARIVICGDGVSAARVPDAYAAGLRAAEFLQCIH